MVSDGLVLTLKWWSKSWAVPCPMNCEPRYLDWTRSCPQYRTCKSNCLFLDVSLRLSSNIKTNIHFLVNICNEELGYVRSQSKSGNVCSFVFTARKCTSDFRIGKHSSKNVPDSIVSVIGLVLCYSMQRPQYLGSECCGGAIRCSDVCWRRNRGAWSWCRCRSKAWSSAQWYWGGRNGTKLRNIWCSPTGFRSRFVFFALHVRFQSFDPHCSEF